jgi:hypothetical protein
MPNNFMSDIGLWRIIRIERMPQILGTAKHTKGQSIQKLSLGKKPMGRFNLKPCFVKEIGA